MIRNHISALLTILAVTGCSSSPFDDGGVGAEGVSRSAIIGGGQDGTTAFSEFLTTVHTNYGDGSYCSAFLLAATVAITEASCVEPVAGAMKLTSVRTSDGKTSIVSETKAISNGGAGIDSGAALLRLQTPIQVASYAKIRTGADDFSKVTLVGQSIDETETKSAHMSRGARIVMWDNASLNETGLTSAISAEGRSSMARTSSSRS